MIDCDVAESTLLDYTLSDLDDAAAMVMEEHLFHCAWCAARAERLERVVDGLRRWASGPPLIATPAIIARHAPPERVQVVEIGPFETRAVPVRDDVDFVVVKVAIDLEGVERVDVVASGPDGEPFAEIVDAPFDTASGAIFATCSRDLAASNPLFRLQIRGSRRGVEVELADCACKQPGA